MDIKAKLVKELADLRRRLDDFGPITNPDAAVSAQIMRMLLNEVSKDMALPSPSTDIQSRMLSGARNEWGNIVHLCKALPAIQQSEKRRKANKDNSQLPRKKEVTKEKLEAFRDAFKQRRKTLWGWRVAACSEYDIDLKTIKKRLGNSDR